MGETTWRNGCIIECSARQRGKLRLERLKCKMTARRMTEDGMRDGEGRQWGEKVVQEMAGEHSWER